MDGCSGLLVCHVLHVWISQCFWVSSVFETPNSHIGKRLLDPLADSGHAGNNDSVYETYYHQEALRSYSPSTISWIGSTQLFFQFAAGIVTGPITDIWGPRVSNPL